MSEPRRPALLDDWDELARTAHRPPSPARVSSRISPPAGAVLLVVSLVLVVLALQGLNSLGPRGSGGTPNVSFGPDAGRADWWLDPAELPLEPDTRVVRGFLEERACASGKSPEGRILGPRIEYRADEVIVTFMVRQISGRCPGNPHYPVSISLDEPLGDRVLVDGGTGRDAAIDPTIVIEPTVDCGPLVGTNEAKVACLNLIAATLGDRYTEFETAIVAPLEGSCASDVCATKAEIEAITWRVDGTDREGIAAVWSCTYREEVAACGPLGHPTSSIALPNPGGTCSADQFALGETATYPGFGSLGYALRFVSQPLRNVGGNCVLQLPATIAIASATGQFRAVLVGISRDPISINITTGQEVRIVLGDSWWMGALTEGGATVLPTPPCEGKIGDVNRVEFPLASGSIEIAWDEAWREVCTSPTSMTVTVKDG